MAPAWWQTSRSGWSRSKAPAQNIHPQEGVQAHRRILWAAAFFLWLLPSLWAVTVGRVEVEGNGITSDRVVLKNMRTRAGEAYSPIIVNEDIKRLYELGLFRRIDLKERIEEGVLVLTLRVVEKPILLAIEVEGNKKVSTSTLTRDLRSKVRDRYDEATAKGDVRLMESIYREDGHLFTRVKSRVVESEDGLSVSLRFEIEEEPIVKVAEIKFVGNERIPAKRLRKLMDTQTDRLLSRGTYEPDVFRLDLRKVQAYYRSLGFLDALVKPGKSYFSENGEWLYLEIVVEEGLLYTIDEININGEVVIDEEELRKATSVKEGQPYTDLSRMRLAEQLEKSYGKIGRVFTRARVQAIVKQGQPYVVLQADIEESEEVYIEGIRIEGNTKTRDVVVRRELEFYPTERINTELVDSSKRNLRNLGFFETIDMDIEPGLEVDQAKVVIRVQEKETGSINFALGFSSVESIFAQVKYTQRNFDWRDRRGGLISLFTGEGYVGDGQTFSIAINTGSKSRRFSIDFSEPWVFNRKIRFGFGVYHTESSIAGDYDETQEGFYLRLGKEFIKDLNGFVTYSLREHKIQDVDPFVSQAIKDEEGTNLVSSIKNEWIYEGRDNRFFPTKGWFVNPSLVVAGGYMGGDQDFYKLEFEAKNHIKVFDFGEKNQHVLSGRLRLGYVQEYGDSDKVAIFERFFAGGMNSVRGFPNRSLSPKENGDEIGGNLLTVFNVEYSVPINEQAIRGVLFWDTGNAYGDVNDFKTDELRMSLGVGIRLVLPALGPMPVSLDFAKPIQRQTGDETETFSFNFGNFF